MRTLAATQDVIFGIKKSWVTYLKAEYKRIDALPAEEQIPLRDALAERRLKVIKIADRVDDAWWAAWAAAKHDNKARPTGNLLALITELKLATQ
jgi:hypothetical protein